MQPDEICFLELLDGKVQYVVPKWQRRYRWGSAQITRLVDDLVLISEAADHERAHYGGSLITFHPDGQPPGPPPIERVVDGQQRLTTVSLLLSCIADVMTEQSAFGEWGRDDIRDLLANPRRNGVQLLKLRLQDGDDDEYKRILAGDPNGGGAVAKAWRLIRQLVEDRDAGRIMRGLERFRIVSLGVGGDDDPQQIFESLNATGLELEESEKVKNWLLMGLSDAQQQEMYDRHWRNIERALGANGESGPIDVFLRDFMRWQTGEIRAIGQTYDALRRWAIETGWDAPTRRPELCARLAHLAELYGILTGTAGRHAEPAIESSLRHLRWMGLDTHRPFTLRLLYEHSAVGKGISSVDQAAKLFEAVGVWMTRLWLADRPIGGLNTAFARMAFLGPGPVESDGYVAEWMKRIRALHRQDVGVPNDEAVERGIQRRGVFRAKKAARAVLCALMEAEHGIEAQDRKTVWTERVMPWRDLSHDWQEVLGPHAEDVHWAWRYRLANLTLVGDVDGAWGEHRSRAEKLTGYGRSTIGLNTWIARQPAWDEETLLRRAKDLAERANRVWPWETESSEPTEHED